MWRALRAVIINGRGEVVGDGLSCLPQVASQVIRWPEGMCKVQSKCRHFSVNVRDPSELQ